MHYIRFLKSPKVVRGNGSASLIAKVTVTTDLGESFLAADVSLAVELLDGNGIVIKTPGRDFLWKGGNGMRSLEIALDIPQFKNHQIVRLLVRPADKIYSTDTFTDVLGLRNERLRVEAIG